MVVKKLKASCLQGSTQHRDDRKGQNAIFVRGVSLKRENPKPLPKELLAQFKSVTELGVFNVEHRKTVIRKIQIFACRDLQ